jgi:deoxyribonuclease V
MEIPYSHPWDLNPAQAIELQNSLRARVTAQPLPLEEISFVAGVDVGFPGELSRAAVVVLSFPALNLVDYTIAEIPVTFPYIPGLLSFREMPAILKALESLQTEPQVFICDGQGLAHPRRFGIACHLGVLLDRPALGCAKSILVGHYSELDNAAGSTAALIDGDEIVGAAVRTRQNVKPVYVSVGNRIDLPSAIKLVLACARGYKLPEPTRLADRLASNRGPLPPTENLDKP